MRGCSQKHVVVQPQKCGNIESSPVFQRSNEVAITLFSMLSLLISLKNVILWLEMEMEDIKGSLANGQNTWRFALFIKSVYFQM